MLKGKALVLVGYLGYPEPEVFLFTYNFLTSEAVLLQNESYQVQKVMSKGFTKVPYYSLSGRNGAVAGSVP